MSHICVNYKAQGYWKYYDDPFVVKVALVSCLYFLHRHSHNGQIDLRLWPPPSRNQAQYIYTYMLPDLHQHHHISSLISTRGALRLHTYNWCTTFDNHPIQFIPSAHDVIKIFWSIKLRRSVDLWWLLDPVLQSPLDDLVKLEITFKHGSILCTRMASRGGDIGDNFIVIESCCDEANY